MTMWEDLESRSGSSLEEHATDRSINKEVYSNPISNFLFDSNSFYSSRWEWSLLWGFTQKLQLNIWAIFKIKVKV